MSELPTPAGSRTPLYMHGKQAIADGVEAFVRSENLTNPSLIQNRELGTRFTDSRRIARPLAVFNPDFTTTGSSLSAKACKTGEQRLPYDPVTFKPLTRG